MSGLVDNLPEIERRIESDDLNELKEVGLNLKQAAEYLPDDIMKILNRTDKLLKIIYMNEQLSKD